MLHDWTVDDGRRILRAVRRALPEEGILLVKESYLQDDWTAGSTLNSLQEALGVLGAPGQSGWQPSYAEMESLMADEGFEHIERRYNLVLARRGGD